MTIDIIELHQIASNYLLSSQKEDSYGLMTKYSDAPPSFRQALLDTLSEYLAAAVHMNSTEPMMDDTYDIGDLCEAVGDARMALKRSLPLGLTYSVPTLVWLSNHIYDLDSDGDARRHERNMARRMGEMANYIVADNT